MSARVDSSPQVADSDSEPDALAVNLSQGTVLMDDDTIALIDICLDSFGCETEDHEDAVVVIARLPDGKWLTVDLRMFRDVETH